MSAKTVAWRCFHCDEVFTDHATAALHFGNSEHHHPACQIDIAEYRRMEETHRRHCEEDTDLHREIHAAHSAGNERARRAEEQGYARGLSDFQTEHTRAEQLAAELERERMRLAACGVVAMSNTRETAAKHRTMLPEYESASCSDVAGAVDREMDHRERAEQLAARCEQHLIDKTGWNEQAVLLNTRAERAEAALRNMLFYFGKPRRDEWMNDEAFKLACECEAAARAIVEGEKHGT